MLTLAQSYSKGGVILNFYINQTINIQTLKIDGVTNSSVLQIGSAGMIRALANLYNTGGFVEPAPEIEDPISPLPHVPLTAPEQNDDIDAPDVPEPPAPPVPLAPPSP